MQIFKKGQEQKYKDKMNLKKHNLLKNSNDINVNLILEEEINDFFPTEGVWYSNCFMKPTEIKLDNLPCHLRDNNWMSRLLYKKLRNKGILISRYKIKKFMDNSKNFSNLRHNYELKIVKWQIEYTINGGKNWIMPKGYDEISLLFSEDFDKIIRCGVVNTLKAIGMNKDVIEEGLEKCADIWRPKAMEVSFTHLFEPAFFMIMSKFPADEEHKQNWLKNREYQYYKRHKDSINKYGNLTPAMQMTPEQHAKLVDILQKQNTQRNKLLEAWKNKIENNLTQNIINNEIIQ